MRVGNAKRAPGQVNFKTDSSINFEEIHLSAVRLLDGLSVSSIRGYHGPRVCPTVAMGHHREGLADTDQCQWVETGG